MAKKAKAPKIDPYVEGFLNKFLDRLTVLEKKVDVVISKMGNLKQAGAPQPEPFRIAPPPPQQNHPPRRERQMYEAICADCAKVCEVPFEPREGRPTYCKICWAKRKGHGHGMPVITPVAIPPKPVSKLRSDPRLDAPPPAAPAKKAKKAAPAKKAKKKKR